MAAVLLTLPLRAAGMPLGIQNDDALVTGDSAAFLARADTIGAEWVRMAVSNTRWPTERDRYILAARRAHEHGKSVMVALVAWHVRPSDPPPPTPDEWHRYTTDVVTAMAPYVDAWSVMNEPNWPGMAPATSIACKMVSSDRIDPANSTVHDGVRVERYWKHVRRGRGTHLRRVHYQRVRAHHHWRRIKHVRYIRARTRKQRRRANWVRKVRRVDLTHKHTVLVTTTKQRRICQAQVFGAAYRAVWNSSAPVVRGLDPTAKLVIGDLAPIFDQVFLESVYSSGEPTPAPDAYGIHSYGLWDGRFAHEHGLLPWVTEWGLAPFYTPADWVAGLDRFEAEGFKLAVIYDTRSGGYGWDTQMRPDDLAAVAEWARR